MPKTVLVPLDGSEFAERALAPAAALAERAGAEVVVMTARLGGVVVDAHHYLEQAAQAAGLPDAECVVVEGRLAATAVLSVAEERPEPTVCLATHARGAVGHAVFGSVAEEILRWTDDAVVLVGPAVEPGPARLDELVLCLDGAEIATGIVPIVGAWARDLHLDVAVLGVTEPQDPSASTEELERTATRLESTERSVERHAVHAGRAADAIVDFVAARPGVWPVLATHGRTGLARVTAGSVTMEVVRRAPVPVVVHRPRQLEG